jgi:hypothetical protein
MTKDEKVFNDFFNEITGITDVSNEEFSPNINEALVKDMDISKTIGNINLIMGNITSIPESNKIVNQFINAKIR